jgi:hypothetical protein
MLRVGRRLCRQPSVLFHVDATSDQDLAAASLSGLARGEVTCIPALEDAALLDKLAEAQRVVLASARTPTAASCYRSHAG